MRLPLPPRFQPPLFLLAASARESMPLGRKPRRLSKQKLTSQRMSLHLLHLRSSWSNSLYLYGVPFVSSRSTLSLVLRPQATL